MLLELLIFEIDEVLFGVPTSHVREVVRAAALFCLPEHPCEVEGGLNLRGDIVPVVSGRAILSLTGKSIEPSDHLIVLEDGHLLAAIRVDRAVELATLEAPDDTDRPAGGKFVRRIINSRSSRGPIAMINVDAVFAICDASASATGEQA